MLPAEPPLLSDATALFLDFDGTLAPLAARPQDVQVPQWVRPVLAALARRHGGAVAIVSGRPIAQLDAFLAPLHFAAAGAHGAEWRGVEGPIEHRHAAPPAPVLACAEALAAAHPGLILEPKASGLSLHYRARPELEALCRQTLWQALAEVPGAAASWGWLHGHFVFELKQLAVSKGVALATLMSQPPFAGRVPVFVGDDVTDEDGIRAAQAAGGFGVRVGAGLTEARFRLPDTEAVGCWLRTSAHASGTVDLMNAR
jgi:trehalose 6-phosphate phosphatase